MQLCLIGAADFYVILCAIVIGYYNILVTKNYHLSNDLISSMHLIWQSALH